MMFGGGVASLAALPVGVVCLVPTLGELTSGGETRERREEACDATCRASSAAACATVGQKRAWVEA